MLGVLDITDYVQETERIEPEIMAEVEVETIMRAPIDSFAVNMKKLINNEDMR